ncbi:MAG: hypothetical protein Fues2KO_42740 [Fuerstiella sp.]
MGVDRFRRHLQLRAADFFPHLNGELQISLVRHDKRHHSQLLCFAVEAEHEQELIIYKIPFCLSRLEQPSFPVEDRPRLFSDIDPLTNGLREFRSLQSVQQHFGDLSDSRFGVITPFELLEAPYVEVMSYCPDPDLKSLLKRATRFHQPANFRIDAAMENAGAWLREFHQMPDLEHTQVRHEERDSFITALERFLSFLTNRLGSFGDLRRLRKLLPVVAERELPDRLPLAVVHGDFAPRNILVADNARVTVFDMQRRWRAPLYEDLAYFLMSLKASGPQVRSQGLIFSTSQLNDWEGRFLRGYFETEIPLARIRLYEILLTLEWWAASLCRLNSRRVSQRARLWLTNRYLLRHVNRLIGDLT